MWNQIGAEGESLHHELDISHAFTRHESLAVLLVRTYAFMGRKLWMFIMLATALCGVMAYQLFTIIHEILREKAHPFFASLSDLTFDTESSTFRNASFRELY
jgi:hypothetical protein